MKNILSKELFILLTLSLFISACSGGGGGSPGDTGNVAPEDEGDPIAMQSCDYQATDGEDVDMLSLQDVNAQETSFGKKINIAWLKAVGKANIVETVKFINNTEAQVYQTPRAKPKGCSRDLFAFTSTLTTDLRDKWNSVKPPEGTVLGLYLPKNEDNPKMPSLTKKAAILLRVNTSKWTLVHEFMHHLFMVEALKDGYDDEVAMRELSDAVDELDELEKDYSTPASEKLTKRIENYKKLSKAFDSMLVHYTLEEMTVEKKMKELSAAKELDYAPKSSNWYLQSSGTSAKEIITDIEKVGNSVYSDAKYSTAHKTALQELEAIQNNWNARKNEISSIMKQFPKDYYNLGSIAFTGDGVEINEGCSHSHQTDEFLKIARRLK